MERTRTAKRHSDWKGLSTVLTTKVTDSEIIALAKAKKATGRTRSELVRQGIAHVTQAAGGGS